VDCLACGITSSPASREHVFSDWLLTEFKASNTTIGLHRRLGDGSRHRQRDEIRLDSFKLKKICENCNNGWMSDLENAAKPLMLGLMKGSISFSVLTEGDRKTLARWAGKTSIVESHAVGAECPVSPKYLRKMRTARDVPGRFAVPACRTDLNGFGHMQISVIRELIAGGKAAGNIILIALPKLVFICAFPMLEIPYECRCVKTSRGRFKPKDRLMTMVLRWLSVGRGHGMLPT
jgi:hypothetical protein